MRQGGARKEHNFVAPLSGFREETMTKQIKSKAMIALGFAASTFALATAAQATDPTEPLVVNGDLEIVTSTAAPAASAMSSARHSAAYRWRCAGASARSARDLKPSSCACGVPTRAPSRTDAASTPSREDATCETQARARTHRT